MLQNYNFRSVVAFVFQSTGDASGPQCAAGTARRLGAAARPAHAVGRPKQNHLVARRPLGPHGGPQVPGEYNYFLI